jgi:hypothetical protein
MYACLLACSQLNVVQFSVAGLGMLSGSLTVKASYEVASDQRVDIKFIESTLVRDANRGSLNVLYGASIVGCLHVLCGLYECCEQISGWTSCS